MPTLIINTRDKITGGTPSNCKINIPPSLIRYFSSVTLKHVTLPTSFYNIRSNNNVLKFTRSSSSYVVTLPQSNYDINSLRTAIQTAINAADSGNSYTDSNDKSGTSIISPNTPITSHDPYIYI